MWWVGSAQERQGLGWARRGGLVLWGESATCHVAKGTVHLPRVVFTPHLHVVR